jgi:hypothetical protein
MLQGTTKQEQERGRQTYNTPQGDPQRELPPKDQVDPKGLVEKAEQKIVGGNIRTDKSSDNGARTTTTPGSSAVQIATAAGELAEVAVSGQIREGNLPEGLRESALAHIKQELDRLAQGVAEKQEQEQKQQEQDRKQRAGGRDADATVLFVDSNPPTERGLSKLGKSLKSVANVAGPDPSTEQSKREKGEEIALTA